MKSITLPALNIQAPWANLIVTRIKTIETRFYPLPEKYIGKEMFIIETPGTSTFKARVIGIVRFGPSFCYGSAADFYRDSRKHLVTRKSSSVNRSSGQGKKKWGWPIESVTSCLSPLPRGLRRGIIYTNKVTCRLSE